MKKIVYLLFFTVIGSIYCDTNREEVFTYIYNKNYWGSKETRSGRGSEFDATYTLRCLLPDLFKELNIKTVLDAACGDFNWMRTVDLSSIEKYIGADIVQPMVEANQQKFGNSKRSFIQLDIVKDPLPEADLIICRDVLFHLTYDEIFSAIRNVKKTKAQYFFSTTYPNRTNKDISTGYWRLINLQKEPFNFPDPLLLVNEEYDDTKAQGKSLALWRVEDLPNFTIERN